MKKIVYILLLFSLMLGVTACGSESPEETTALEETENTVRTKFSYPSDYLIESFDAEAAVACSTEYYNAISEAFPNRPVLAVINNSYFGTLYSVALNDALNVWLEENGYNFAVMIFSFGIQDLRVNGTFEQKVEKYVEAGGKCDVIVTGANVSTFGIVPADTIWDFVDDGLVLALNSADLSGVEQKYGKAFIERNTFNGNVYGFSVSALEGYKNSAYVAVRNECLPLVEGMSGEELVDAILEDREFLEEAKALADTDYALGYDDSTFPPYILPELCLGEGYTRVNYLPLYIDQNSAEPRVIALWEAPEFESTLKKLSEIEKAGLSSCGTGETAFSAAMAFYCGFENEDAAQKTFSDKASRVAEFEYTLIPLGGVTEAVGPECAMFLSACSENKDVATEFILTVLCDEGLGSALTNGVEGYSYEVENGKFISQMNDKDTWVYPNKLYMRDDHEHVERLYECFRELQGTAEFELYENFCADLSGCYDEATALVKWYLYYLDAGSNIADYSGELKEDLEFAGIIPVDDFFADPRYPDIDAMKADIEAQIAEYLKAYN